MGIMDVRMCVTDVRKTSYTYSQVDLLNFGAGSDVHEQCAHCTMQHVTLLYLC